MKEIDNVYIPINIDNIDTNIVLFSFSLLTKKFIDIAWWNARRMPTKDIIIPICCGPQLNLASDQRAKIPFRPEKTKLTKKYNMKRYERFLYFKRDNIVLVVSAGDETVISLFWGLRK